MRMELKQFLINGIPSSIPGGTPAKKGGEKFCAKKSRFLQEAALL